MRYKPREWWISFLSGRAIHDKEPPPKWPSIRVVEYSGYKELQAKYNFMVDSAQQNAKERDEALNRFEELKSYIPKVPTQPYEKELAQQLATAVQERDTALISAAKEFEDHRFYKREWESACERYDYTASERDELKTEVEHLRWRDEQRGKEIEKLKSEMGLVVSNAGKDLIAERDQLKLMTESYKTMLLTFADIVDDALLLDEQLSLAWSELRSAVVEVRAALEGPDTKNKK